MITDFSGLRSSAERFSVALPRSAPEVRALVRSAGERGLRLRIRGQGHSLNGASLPASDELLVDMRDLRALRFAQPGSVTVGAGAVLWIVQAVLRDLGFDLPVLNDGYPGPTVGGYLAAGGFGPGSATHGGFWDNVIELTLVDGGGELRKVTPGDALFPWLFGAMGQLGIVAEATLSVIPLNAAANPADYPVGKAGILRRLAQQHVPLALAPKGDERLFWFTLFVPDEEVEEAQRELRALELRHAQALRFAERYRYPVRHRGRVAPLVYPPGAPSPRPAPGAGSPTPASRRSPGCGISTATSWRSHSRARTGAATCRASSRTGPRCMSAASARRATPSSPG